MHISNRPPITFVVPYKDITGKSPRGVYCVFYTVAIGIPETNCDLVRAPVQSTEDPRDESTPRAPDARPFVPMHVSDAEADPLDQTTPTTPDSESPNVPDCASIVCTRDVERRGAVYDAIPVALPVHDVKILGCVDAHRATEPLFAFWQTVCHGRLAFEDVKRKLFHEGYCEPCDLNEMEGDEPDRIAKVLALKPPLWRTKKSHFQASVEMGMKNVDKDAVNTTIGLLCYLVA